MNTNYFYLHSLHTCRFVECVKTSLSERVKFYTTCHVIN